MPPSPTPDPTPVDPTPSPAPMPTPGTGGGPAFAEAPHPSGPLLDNRGGPVLATPHIVLITWDGDDLRDSLETFASRVGSSKWWAETVSEYGIGAADARTVHLSTAPPAAIDDTQVQAWLAANLTASGLLGAPEPDTIYTLATPKGTAVTSFFMRSCIDNGGYHSETTAGGQGVVYAVIPRCDKFPAPFDTLMGLDLVTLALGHELAEAATDPHGLTAPGYMVQRATGAALAKVKGLEAGDICLDVSTLLTPPDLGFLVQPIWSNVAATAGHAPCVPAPSRAYFNVSATPPDQVIVVDPYNPLGLSYAKVSGVQLAEGESKTLPLTLFSDAPTESWTLTAEDTGKTPILSFSFSTTTGRNGDIVQLTIQRSSAAGQAAATTFVVHSTLNGVTNDWYGMVSR
jgi:hypothetical protein